MLAFKTTLALLFIIAASAMPTSSQWPEYDGNGQVQDLTFERRAAAICQPDDKDIVALKSNKADGSAFCSTYLQSTKTITATPLVTSDMTKTVTKTAILLKFLTVRINVYHIVRTKVMKTVSTVITETKTDVITDFATKLITNTMTDISTDTDTTQLTKTNTEHMTDVVTEQVTKTITTTVDVTSTVDVTDIDTEDVTVNVPTTVIVTHVTLSMADSTAERLITSNRGAVPTIAAVKEFHCAVKGNANSANVIASKSENSWDSCRSFCAWQDGVSFTFGFGTCVCYDQPTIINVTPDSGSNWCYWDQECPSQSKPAKRAVPVKQVPSYLPLKDPRVVSSACSCHITNRPAAAKTRTLTAKESKTVHHVVTEYTTSYITKKKVTTVYSQRTRTATDFKTVAKTGRNTKAVTQRKSATMTKPVTVTVTNYKTVVITNHNTVAVTNRNTIHTTNYNTASKTAYNSVFITNVGYVTVTEYDTVMETDIATNTVIPKAVTVDGGNSYIWGS
ncbi:hypothetical protein FPHYL_10494 [Fusarium phyllophilum]|uniref:Uncharacterized protein n=1 Tax=Fusarium phyllophilum TaxID=47803 RepID=A0A8H5J178_9HYPO|nr:hypothetical protein FPHYL_10494 [Fusarium phyllophilum]